MNKIKNKLTILLFFAVLLIFSFGQFLPDEEVSKAERRKLEQKPDFTVANVLSGDYSKDMETYLLDQFPFRDSFRTVQSLMNFYVWHRMDSNDIWLADGKAFKIEYPLKEDQVAYGVDYINGLIEGPLKNSKIYHSLIPDRNYFVQGGDYPTIDYERLVEMIQEIDGTYIDIMPLLSLDDYYHTDAHWKQECIYPVAEHLAKEMGVTLKKTQWTAHSLEDFYGVYMGQAALPLKADTLTYCTSPETEQAIVTGAEFQGEIGVYTPERFDGLDGYDVFLNGAQAILTIESPLASTEKELVIFRDSFASSLAPYLVSTYQKITLIDMRYVNHSILEQFVDFHGQDVLFLYSTGLYNAAMLWK